MKPLALSWVAQVCEGRLHGADVQITSVSIDSRSLGAGAMYVALRGQRFDGHDFCAAAEAAGAVALLLARPSQSALPQVLCADPEHSLGLLARALQAQRRTRVLALTGSNGKSTVKSLLLAILQRFALTYANPGNRNNEIGLPLAVLDAPEDAAFAVYEMGAGKPGDIAWLADIAPPDVALINNIAPAHLQRMGSLFGVAQTKGAIYQALAADGVAVINVDDAFAPYFAQIVGKRRVLRFALRNDAEVTASALVHDAEGSRFRLHLEGAEVPVRLLLPGRHNVRNALAAAAMAHAVGVPAATIADGLASAVALPGRQQAYVLGHGLVLIDDSYNANPGSTLAAIDLLAGSSAETWLVLGDMAELGAGGERLHAEVGQRAHAAGIERLWTTGSLSAAASAAFGALGRHFESKSALIVELARAIAERASTRPLQVLVKGSRSSAMEQVVEALRAAVHTEVNGNAA